MFARLLNTAKEHGCAKDVEGLPLAKDHNSHGKEACAGHAHLKFQVCTGGTM